MIITKTINDLNEATSLNSEDVLPISQSGQSEATKATVGQLVSYVAGSIGGTGSGSSDGGAGSMSELVYATDQGKNLLAQRLTEKGVPTTSSETLIQMADKVQNLIIDNSVDVLEGPIYYKNESVNIDSVYNTLAFQSLSNEDKIVWSNSKVYYIPAGDYDSFEEWFASATSILEAPAMINYAGFMLDKNEEYFVLPESTTKIRIYKANKEEQSITFIKSIELTHKINDYASAARMCLVFPGGEWLVYCSNYSSYRLIAINIETEEEFESNTNYYLYEPYGCYLSDDNTGFVYTKSYKDAFTDNYKTAFSINNGVFTWANSQISTHNSNLNGTYLNTIPFMERRLNVTYSSSVSQNLSFVTLKIISFDNVILNTYTQKVFLNNKIDFRFLYICNPIIIKEDENIYKIKLHPFWPAFTYNTDTNELTFEDPENFIPVEYKTDNNYHSVLFFYNKNNKTLVETHATFCFPYKYIDMNSNKYKYYYSSDYKITGFKRTSATGNEFYYPVGIVSETDLNNGALNFNTTVIPVANED